MSFCEWWDNISDSKKVGDDIEEDFSSIALEAWSAAIKEERERCARLAENYSAELADEIRRG